MTTPRVRIVKDFSEYFLSLTPHYDIGKIALNIISTDYGCFYNNIIWRNMNDEGYLDNDNIRDICNDISSRLKMQNPQTEMQKPQTDLDNQIKQQIFQLHRDLFL